MTIYVNGYNQQFQKFVDFASQKVEAGKGQAIARLDDAAGNLGGHVITEARNDGVGGLSAFFRKTAQKTLNNTMREQFRNTVIELFGGINKVPDSVLKAMKLEDYGQGKPLTAHRIMVVKASIDDVRTRFDTAFQTATAKTSVQSMYSRLDDEGKAQLDERIRNIIASCIDNPDLLAVVSNNMDSILVSGDGNPRTEAGIEKKINDLKTNYAELRELAKKNPSVLELGKAMIASLNGKSLPRGLIGKLMEAAQAVPIKALTNLSASSSAHDIHKAVTQFLKIVNDVMNETDAENLMDGSDEKVPCRDFALALVMARCGKSAVRKMQAALNSETAAKLLNMYNAISNGDFNKNNMSDGLVKAIKDQANSLAAYVNQLKQAVDISRGIPREDFNPLDEFDGQFDFGEIDGLEIFDEIIDAGRKQLADERENYLGQVVNGKGKGVAQLRAIVEAKIGPEAYNPREIVRQDARKIAKDMINWALVADCKLFAEGKGRETMFCKGLSAGMVVKLPDGKKLSNDFATACDEIARFVTGKADATYVGLDAKAKGKAHVIMSLLSQDTMKAAKEGNALAFDPNRTHTAFSMVAEQDETKHVFTLELTQSGVLFVNFEGNEDIKGFFTGEADFTEVGAGSKYSSQFSLQLDAKEFDRLAELDYKQFDSEAAQDVFNSSDKNKTANTVNSFAPQFKLDPVNASCDTTFSITVN